MSKCFKCDGDLTIRVKGKTVIVCCMKCKQEQVVSTLEYAIESLLK